MMKYAFFFVSVLNYLLSRIRSIPCINGEASAFLFHNLLYGILVSTLFHPADGRLIVADRCAGVPGGSIVSRATIEIDIVRSNPASDSFFQNWQAESVKA